MQKIHWKDYLSFSKKERQALIILTVCIAIVIALPWLIKPKFTPPVISREMASVLADTSINSVSDFAENNDTASIAVNTTPIQLFYFDPNTLDKAGWKKLGLLDRNIQTILNYRSKGGKFSAAEDIHKIYGLKKTDADRLEPYIKIEQINSFAQKEQQEKKVIPEQEIKTYKKININTATEEDWKALPGIGDVLAKRIVKFRNSMNGFKSIHDVKKTYGLKDSVFQIIAPLLTLNE